MNVYTRVAPIVLAFLVPWLAACSGGDKGDFPDVTVIRDDQVVPVIANSEIVTGPNRLVFAVVAPDQSLIVDAKVRLVFYELAGGQATQRFEADAVSSVPARDAGIAERIEHVHADGSRHTHVSVGNETGFYTANVTFERTGDWGVELLVQSSRPAFKGTLRTRFNVVPQGTTPPIGAPAPRSRNATVADVADISEVDSSANPTPELHTTTIADAIAAGKPALVLFAVPGFCTSRLCGPELEIMRKLAPKYSGRAEFIHVEFYKNPASPNKTPVEAVQEWGLRSEPWFFVIDAKGLVAAKFEGPAGLAELDEALKAVVP